MNELEQQWIFWFLVLIFLAFSPIVAPYNELWLIWGIPSTLFWWLVISVVIILSIIVFVIQLGGENE
ncbi:hypothetical protein HOE07_02750 [archaeon]|nr:hypothetical protein [archaeon]